MTNWIGFDYGKRYIGVAIGNGQTKQAVALQTISAKKGVPDWKEIDRIVSNWAPQGFIIGYPLNMDGSAQTMTKHVLTFKKNLSSLYQKPCYFVDERLSSYQAKNHLPKQSSKADLDSQSAQIILQHWFDEDMPMSSD